MKSMLKVGHKYIANVFIHFDRLKGVVKTQTGKKSISRGQWFIPLTDGLTFTYFGCADDLFTEIKETKGNNNETI